MILTEMHHAFIAAIFHRLLCERDEQGGRDVFAFAIRKYAEERGARMAQRALRDGKPLDLRSFSEYGEWNFTSASLWDIRYFSRTPDMHYAVYKCPWNTQFRSMGATEAARDYCRDLDMSLARGFNPYLPFQTLSTVHTGGHCEFLLPGAGAGNPKAPSEDDKRTFSYHCAHLFATLARILHNVYGKEGDMLAHTAAGLFGKEYGATAAKDLINDSDCDFWRINGDSGSHILRS